MRILSKHHDLEMLRMGPYPWSLKQRILGDRGHLSNEDGALVMADILTDNTKRVYLGHLSKENNLKELHTAVCRFWNPVFIQRQTDHYTAVFLDQREYRIHGFLFFH